MFPSKIASLYTIKSHRRLPPSNLPTMTGTYVGVAYYMPALVGGAEGYTVKIGTGDDIVKRCNIQRVNILYGVEEDEEWLLAVTRRIGPVLQSDWAFGGYTETFGLFETRREAEDFAESLVSFNCTVRYDYRDIIQRAGYEAVA